MLDTVEDILSLVVSCSPAVVLPADKGILTSIDRQVKRGAALTDRQHDLVKTKLLSYKDFLFSAGITDLQEKLDVLKCPLRSVDRSKSVVINNGLIEVKFPFNKKTIVTLDSVVQKCKRFYSHEKGSNIHKFKLNEVTVNEVISAFQHKNFYIDPDVNKFYEKIKEIEMNKESVLPGIYNNKLENFKKSALDLMYLELGPLTSQNLIKFYDRRRRYGIADINGTVYQNTLIETIAYREETEIAVNPEMHSLDSIVDAMLQLERFPILVLVDTESPLHDVAKVYNAFRDVVPNEEQTVLFRVDNSENYNLNNFIHDNKINNWLDTSTKIVYINKNKLPKLLLRSSWQPMATLALSSYRSNSHVTTYIKDVCDLIIYHDKSMSIIGNKRKYGNY
jgi:hypothetical protein